MSFVRDAITKKLSGLLTDADGRLMVTAEGVALTAGDITVDLASTNAKLDELITLQETTNDLLAQIVANTA